MLMVDEGTSMFQQKINSRIYNSSKSQSPKSSPTCYYVNAKYFEVWSFSYRLTQHLHYTVHIYIVDIMVASNSAESTFNVLLLKIVSYVVLVVQYKHTVHFI